MRPDAEEYVGNYVKAIHDFTSGLSGEISLQRGDIFKVIEVIDKNWLRGKNKDREGNFPRDFVEKLQLPLTERDQKIFAATDNFPAQQDGDLDFRKGDVILGLGPIDASWWQGQCRGQSGIFPITHVMELEIPLLLRQRSQSVHSAEPLFAQALVDSVAQLDEELGFQAGDIIKVTEVLDTDWYIGECHGKSGMFLAACVRLLNEDECTTASDKPVNHSSDFSNFERTNSYHQTNIHNNQYSETHQDMTAQDVGSVNYDRLSSYTNENTKAHNDSDSGVTPYARTLYPFKGELADELSFNANDIVTLIQHVDEQWIEGEIDGKIGVFPANYVEIVVDCPYAYFTDETTDLQAGSDVSAADDNIKVSGAQIQNADISDKTADAAVSETATNVAITEASPDEKFALVLYTFKAETEQDLDVSEGETVTVIKQIDSNWLLVKNDSGKSGMCPCGFVEMIGEIPEFTEKVHDSNDNEIHKQSEENIREQSPARKSSPISAISNDIPENSSSVNNITNDVSSKHKLKPKPALAPKPALKPKPIIGAKPFSRNSSTGHKNVNFQATVSTGIPKSSSSQCLPGTKSLQEDKDGVESRSMTKAKSMFEISQSGTEDMTSSSLAHSKDSDTDSTGSLNHSGESSKSNDSSKKTFEDWDMTKPLDNLLDNEFSKARKEAEKKLSFRSKSESQNKPAVSPKPDVVRQPSISNYSRKEYEDGLSIGNSVFFVDNKCSESSARKTPQLRKPPPPPVQRTSNKESPDFNRRPSLKKPAPQRPVGPRMAPLPSKTPIVPTRTAPAHTVPGQGRGTPARPQGVGPRKHGRPAPPRPAKRSGDNLMSFSPPPNTSLDAAVEEESDVVLELKCRIGDLEAEIETFKKSKSELELMRENAGEGNVKEIHDNIEFYEDNIRGLTEELATLKDQLAEHCPKARSEMEEEKAAVLRKLEEEKAREELKKRQEEQRLERRGKRCRVIEELIQTEKDFITSLSLVMDTFMGASVKKHPDIDLEHLFGNIEEVADISQRLYTKLEEATNGKDFQQQIIGSCFTILAEDMKNVYAPYCRNHDDVITLIEKYDQNESIKSYLDTQLDILREKHVVFDLEALLIKPVQRVLKYPLLLNELIKATEDDHPDKVQILAAIKAMTDVATAINEYKRRKDLVYKYKKDTEVSLGDKLSKLSLHSIRKKSSRIRERFSANLGFIEQTRDSNFDHEETRYRHLEKTVRVFIRDVQSYLDEVQEAVSAQESLTADIEDFYGEKRDIQNVQKLQTFYNTIHMTFLPNFKMEAAELVTLPLTQLCQMFEGPNKVIQKRYDKLLDYDNLRRKSQSDKTWEKMMQTAKQTYEALNDQLLDELPRLYMLSFQLLQDCVGSFVRAQREFTSTILQDMYNVMDLHLLHEAGVLGTFNIQHTAVVDRLALLSFMPRSFSPRVADQKQDKKSKRMSIDDAMHKSTEAVPQIDSQRIFVIQQYSPSKLFRITETQVAMDAMDITACAGDVVGVIMEKDPMGNTEKWFVDNGVSKGFIAKKNLTPYEASTGSPSLPASSGQMLKPSLAGSGHLSSPQPSLAGSSHLSSPGSVSYQSTSSSVTLHSLHEETDDMDFALNEDMMPAIPDSVTMTTEDQGLGNPGYAAGAEEEDIELYYAEYPFTARNDNEVTMFEHQVMTVLAKYDQDGNTEWWYVDADGKMGYAPAAYLRKMDSHGGPT